MSCIAVETDEVWKVHPACNERYMISNHGRVRSIARGKLMKLRLDAGGYVTLSTKLPGGRNITLRVHRMVAECFLGKPEDESLQVNHKDGDKTNNYPDNLEWVTASENCQHAWDNGLQPRERECKLSKEDKAFINQHYIPKDPKWGTRGLAKRFNVAHSTIRYALGHI